MTELTARELLVMLFATALDAVDGRYLVNQWCRNNSATTSSRSAFTHCVAVGKAATAMLQGALDCLPELKKSLLICPPAKLERALMKNPKISCLSASHPVPDESSLLAGQALIDFVASMQADDELLFLISGGTSSLLELPVEGVSLQQLQQVNTYLLSSGKDICQVNAWRQQFSQIKGGGLLRWIKTPRVTQLLLSDVKADEKAVIGSGLLLAPSVVAEPDDYLNRLLPAPPALKKATPGIEVDSHIIGNIRLAMQAVQQAALAEGVDSFIHEKFIEGDAVVAAGELYRLLQSARPGIHIWGGETTVRLPEKPGIGGRNQTLALAFAQYLAESPGLHLLAAGTDGVDGNSSCAGAVVSMFTAKKAAAMGFDITREIKKANAGLVLMATDDLLKAIHSNTNVMDIFIAYKL